MLASETLRANGMSGQACIGDPVNHGVNGLGNQLMAEMSNALLAILFSRCLVIRSPLVRASFKLPSWVRSDFDERVRPRPLPEGRSQLVAAFKKRSVPWESRWWRHNDHFSAEIKALMNTSSVQAAMHTVGSILFSVPSVRVYQQLNVLIRKMGREDFVAMHIRTLSDARCPLGKLSYGDCGQCVSTAALKCVREKRRRTSAVIFGDNARTIDSLVVSGDLREEELFGRNTSKLVAGSTSAGTVGGDPAVIWHILRTAPSRVISSTSTFSKSALLCSNHIRRSDLIADFRCWKDHPSDGMLFSCRLPKWRDLV